MRLYELYQESQGSVFTHDGQKYDLNALLIVTEHFEVHDVPVSEVIWVLEWDEADPARVAKANIQKPILVTWWKDEDADDHKLVVLDGLHRIAKAQQSDLEYISARYVEAEDLKPCVLD